MPNVDAVVQPKKKQKNNIKISSFNVPDMDSFLDTKIVYPTRAIKNNKFGNLISRNPTEV